MTEYSTTTSGDLPVPRVWIVPELDRLEIVTEEDPDGMPVDMNASLYRQILHANKQYHKFQNILNKFYTEAINHPNSVRRVR